MNDKIMYFDFGDQGSEDLEQLQEALEQDLSRNPVPDELTGAFSTYVAEGGYDIEDVLYAVASSDHVFPDVGQESQLRIENAHDDPEEGTLVRTARGDDYTFEEMRELVEERNPNVVLKYDEDAHPDGRGGYHKEHRFEVPDNIDRMRRKFSDSLMDFVWEASKGTSPTVGGSSTLYGDEQFAQTAWSIFQEEYDLDFSEKHQVEDAVETWIHDPHSVREDLVENEVLQNLSEFNREILREMHGDAKIPLRRAKSLEGSEEEVRENSAYETKRSLPESWGFKPLEFYRKDRDYGLSIDLRNLVDIDDVVLSPHILDGITPQERGEWIVDDDREEFTDDEFRYIQAPEAEFIEPEMIWTYQKLLEQDII